MKFRRGPSRPQTIPAEQPRDIAYDAQRDTLYISTDSEVLRYSLREARFEAPFLVGSHLMGMDLSPDGTLLAVADDATDGTSVWVHLIDLESDAIETRTFPADFYEAGTWSLVLVDDQTLLTTSDFQGSGWAPFRQIDLESQAVVEIASVRQWTMLAASANRDVIALAQGNISDGRWGRYVVSTQTYEERDWYEDGTAYFNFEVAISPAGDEIVIPTYGGAFLFDSSLQHDGALGRYATDPPLAAAYDPIDGSLYLSIGYSDRIDRYDPMTHKKTGSFHTGHVLDWSGNIGFVNGRMRITPDGKRMFITTTSGVAVVPLRAAGARFRRAMPSSGS